MHINRETLRQKNPEEEPENPEESLQDKTDTETTIPGRKVRMLEIVYYERPKKKKKKTSRVYILLAVILAVILAAVVLKIYLDNSYHPANQIEDLDTQGLNIELSDNMLVVRNPSQGNTKTKTGIIFYQDLRVDGECYLPLMVTLAKMGYDCFLPVSFGNQSYLNVEGAESVIRKYESIDQWVIAAHGDACPVAASYVKGHPDKVQGLVYLGGSSDKDISSLPVSLLSLAGTNDTVIDQETFEKNMANDPEDAEYQIIEGANNSGFADTVLRKNDSQADISFQEQIETTADRINSFIQSHLS